MKLASPFSLVALIAALLLCGLQPAKAGTFEGPYFSYGTPVGNADSAIGGGSIDGGVNVTDSNQSPTGNTVITATGQSSFETDISNIYADVTLDVPNVKMYYIWRPDYAGDTMPTNFSSDFMGLVVTVTNEGSESSGPGVPPPPSASNDGSVECGFGSGTATGDVGQAPEAASYTLETQGSNSIIGNNEISTAPISVSGGIYPITAGDAWTTTLRMFIGSVVRLPSTPSSPPSN